MDEPRIVHLEERKLAGIRIQTSLAENRTAELWQRFRPRIKEIPGKKNSEFYSIQIFEKDLKFGQFTLQTRFEKWAAVEVNSFENLPEGLESFVIPSGRYAIFIHKGTPDMFQKTSQYIFGQWLPSSEYQLDNRPHFEIMDENYRPDDSNAEEEVWVPIRKK